MIAPPPSRALFRYIGIGGGALIAGSAASLAAAALSPAVPAIPIDRGYIAAIADGTADELRVIAVLFLLLGCVDRLLSLGRYVAARRRRPSPNPFSSRSIL